MRKCVNGKYIDLSSNEEAETIQRWENDKITPEIIDARKIRDAAGLVNFPSILACIEEFTALFESNGLTVPANLKDLIIERVKQKL